MFLLLAVKLGFSCSTDVSLPQEMFSIMKNDSFQQVTRPR
jgi:hypothetical protein